MVLISLSQAIEPVGGYTSESDAWPVRCQTYGYLPNHTASQPFGRYQFILLGEQRHIMWYGLNWLLASV